MGYDSKIIIYGSQYLFSYASFWFACEDMWEGIIVQEGGSIRSYQSTYEDAEFLMTVDEGGILSLVDNVFNRNMIGITNGAASSITGAINVNSFYDNTFTCTSDLNVTTKTNRSYAGIYLNQSAASFGNIYNSNSFEYLRNGIVAINSAITIRNLVFENIINVDHGGLVGTSIQYGDGYGIYAEGGELNIKAIYNTNTEAWIGRTIFENCEFIGISGNGANLNIEAAIFGGISQLHAASTGNIEGQNVNISYCRFDVNNPLEDAEALFALYVERGTGSGSSQVHNKVQFDTFYVDELFQSASIHVNGPYPATDRMEVKGNYISCNGVGNTHGIQIFGGLADKFIVEDNNVMQLGDDHENKKYGIFFLESRSAIGHSCSYNQVTAELNAYQCAIHIEDFQNLTLCDNYVNETRQGIHLSGDNEPLELKVSDINTHPSLGLAVSNSEVSFGINGPQVRHGNTWLTSPGAYGTNAAKCFSEPKLSTFYMENTNLTIFPTNIDPPANWFQLEMGDLHYCQTYVDGITPSYSFTDSILLEALAFDTSSISNVWTEKRNLMFKLFRFDSLLAIAKLDSFFDDGLDSTYGEHAQLDYKYFKFMLPFIQSSLDSVSGKVQVYLDSLHYLDTINRSYNPGFLDSTILAVATATYDSLEKYNSMLYDLRNGIDTVIYDSLYLLLSQINSLTTVTNAEIASKQLMQMRITRLIHDSLSLNELTQMQTLANGNSNNIGNSVSMARMALFPCKWQELGYESYEEEPLVQQLPVSSSFESDAEELMYVSPNPTYGEYLDILWQENSSGTIQLVDLSGRQYFYTSLDDVSAYRIKLSDSWHSGSYYLIYTSIEGRISTQKVIIIE